MGIIFFVKYNLNSALTGDRRGAQSVLVGRPEVTRPLGKPSLRWEEILKWMFKKWCGEARTGLLWLRIGTEAVLLRLR
jgi:hypothetical protein